MNGKQAKRARRKYFTKDNKTEETQYGTDNGKTLICQGARQKYQRLKAIMQQMNIRLAS